MGQRLELQAVLQEAIGVRPDGKENVYFQPPESVRMNYPCILYRRASAAELRADNQLYRCVTGYTVTVIDPDPDSDTPNRVRKLPMCRFDRHYSADNLNHDVFTLYF